MKLAIGFALISIALGRSWITPDQKENGDGASPPAGTEDMARIAPPQQLPPFGSSPIVQPGRGPIVNPALNPVAGVGGIGGIGVQSLYFSPIIITVDPTSQLWVPPGAEGQIVLVLKNDGLADFFLLSAVFDYNFFVQFEYPTVQLGRGQTIRVGGRIRVPIDAAGKIATMTVIVQRRTDGYQSRRQIQIRARSQSGDWWGPWCTITQVTRCEGYVKEDVCSQRYWNFRAEIQDTDSGLLSISLKPEGRFLREDFIVGTNQSVPVEQSVSCCTSAVDITALDTRGNSVKCRVDQYGIYLLGGDIAAIVLGVIMLVILIIVVVLLICRCLRRKKTVPVANFRKKRDQQ